MMFVRIIIEASNTSDFKVLHIHREKVEDRVFFFHASGQIFKIIENLNSYWIRAQRGVA
jgi:hypothetical protein